MQPAFLYNIALNVLDYFHFWCIIADTMRVFAKINNINLCLALTVPYFASTVCCLLFSKGNFLSSVRQGFDGHPIRAVKGFYNAPNLQNFDDLAALSVVLPGLNYWAMRDKSILSCSCAIIANAMLCYTSVKGNAGISYGNK